MGLIRVLFSCWEKRIMDHSEAPAATVRRDGWSEARKARFLEHLAGRGNVRAACAVVGLSHEAAYQLRRRDALFARAWTAALVLAREASAQVLACRALDGIEEEVWSRGEVVGTRRRYDSRLLLAHLARLDAAAASGSAREDAERFDELVALIGGAVPPDDIVCGDDGVPLSRADTVALEIEAAEAFAREDAGSDAPEGEALSPAARYTAGLEAAAQWDAWRAQAHAAVDRLLAQPLGGAVPAWTLSGVSSSALAQAIAAGHPAAG
jgi:hypothetical protein